MSSGSPRALITGGGGQDGTLLARHLLNRGWDVVATVRTSAQAGRLGVYAAEARPVFLDLRDEPAVEKLLVDTAPRAVFNLAAVSSVGQSWREPDLTWSTNYEAAVGLLDAIARTGIDRDVPTRFVQASSAEVRKGSPSPYARAKSAAEQAVRQHRERGMHASVAVLHPHESPLRSPAFVSRKITLAAARISLGLQHTLRLGDIHIQRDWGAAQDHVAALALMATRDEPADFEIGTGRTNSLADLVLIAFAAAGLGDPWRYVVRDGELTRPHETERIVADTTATADNLGWRATVGFRSIIERMVAVDITRLQTGVEDDSRYLQNNPPKSEMHM